MLRASGGARCRQGGEAGMRTQVDGWGVPPEKGTRMAVTIDLEKGFVDLHGELIWVTSRGPQWLPAMRFDDVQERDADRPRQRVFEALRGACPCQEMRAPRARRFAVACHPRPT